MTNQMAVGFRRRNPDILTCIANLSNDEVFTPPKLANEILDRIEAAWAEDNAGENIWTNPRVRFLDPVTKSGVFLREITARLTKGLADRIPDLKQRVDHILTHQVFGIAITELTSLISRRSVYCSKWANGPHSIAQSFDTEAGNIWFEPQTHTWKRDRCVYCGATRAALDRPDDRESHAYPFIHTRDIKARIAEMFGGEMQFDVIVGNPPYHLNDGGHGASALPIYHHFVDQAKRLQPRFLTMIIPSRWFAGGRGLDAFRMEMLTDDRIRVLVDYVDSRDCFPGVDVAGGVCYFLWNRDHPGECEVVSHTKNGSASRRTRPLLEPGADVFVRYNEAISILKKIAAVETGNTDGSIVLPEEKRFSRQVSRQKPFGLRTYFRGDAAPKRRDDVKVLQSRGESWARRSAITDSVEHIDRWKVFTSKSSSEHAGQADRDGRRRVLSKSGVLPPGTVVTETYVLLGSFDTEQEARNCFSYVTTRLFRFLVVLRSSAQDISRSAYGFVPIQDFAEPWSDEKLYAKYSLTDAEIAFVESLIRPWTLD